MSDSSAPQESGIVLSASGLTRSFRSGSSFLEVLRGVDLELKRGEVCALRGASGSGKSTLLHILGLLDQADQGQLQIDGQQVTTFGASRLAKLRSTHIGFVFQQFQLLPELSALENVLVPRRLIHGFSWWG
ncbi:MAG: lipoprotein-releasing system ATP-binding protein LolD, partial [Planctomycetota bacterium]